MAVPYDEIDVNPRQAEEIAARLIVLATLNRRIGIELSMLLLPGAQQYAEETDRFDLYSWARKELADWISIEELAFLKTSVGKMTDEQMSDHGYDLDAALALAWALGIVGSPHLTVHPIGASDHEIERMMNWAPEPWDRVKGKLRRLKLRSVDELWNERERCAIVWYRWALAQLKESSETKAALAMVVQVGESLGLSVKAGDLVFDGLPIEQLPEETQLSISDVAIAYLHALSWTCGVTSGLWDVPLVELQK